MMKFAIFSSLNNDRIFKAIDCPATAEEFTEAMGEIYKLGLCSPAEYIRYRALSDDNIYYRRCAKGAVEDCLRRNFEREAEYLSRLAGKAPEDYQKKVEFGDIPFFPLPDFDLYGEIALHAENITTRGWGIYSQYTVFELDENCRIVPVTNPDDISLGDLIDYQRERNIVLDNTVALLEGKPAANILLTGDAGTGKSSTVKAVVNALAERGLRILQVSKDQLHYLKKLFSILADNPLKFIVFIDDLSFRHDDDNSRALKAVLEGSVSAKSKNVVIYATSNRRHIVRESLKEREGDEVHRNDAMQETLSLSERFGIRISFYRPDKQTYLNIVKGLAEASGVDIPEEELFAGAERFALERGLRSPRAARQYIDGLLAK